MGSSDQKNLPASEGAAPSPPRAVATAINGGRPAQAAAASLPGGKSSRHVDRRQRQLWIWTVCAALLLGIGLVFGQTARCEFVNFDDEAVVSQNPHVRDGFTSRGLWWAVTSGPLGQWIPVTALSHLLDCQLFGLSAGAHHLTNVVLHAVSALLLFWVLLRMTGDLWPSAWVAAIFALHPLHVETVAWISGRCHVLAGLFFMLTLLAYSLYVERPSLLRYLAVAGCFALGLMSKSILVTVPFVLLLLDYWPLGRFGGATPAGPGGGWGQRLGQLPVGWRLVLEKIPLLLLTAASCAIVLATEDSLQSGNSVERLPLASRLANAAVAAAAYLGQSVFPVDLAIHYPHLGNRQPIAAVAGASLLLAAITAAAACLWRRQPYLIVGWLWFLGMLVPASGLVQNFTLARADRYTYLSQIGLSIAVAWGALAACRSWRFLQSGTRSRQWLLSGAATALLVLAAVAWHQTRYWHDSETLWLHTLAFTESNAKARYNLAVLYAGENRHDEATAQLRAALDASSIDPALCGQIHGMLAAEMAEHGQIDQAIAQLEEAIRIFPEGSLCHAGLASLLARKGEHDRALAELAEAARLAPSSHSLRLSYAAALLAHGDDAAAAAECRELLKRQPDLLDALLVLGQALLAQGKADEASTPLEWAIDLEPLSAEAHFRLGLALCDSGRPRSGVAQLDEAIRLAPGFVPALWQAAWILATSPDATTRDAARAVSLARKAAQLSDGSEPRVFDALAAALAESGDYPAAIEAAARASGVALVHDDKKLSAAIEERKRLYSRNQPYHQPAASPSAAPGQPDWSE